MKEEEEVEDCSKYESGAHFISTHDRFFQLMLNWKNFTQFYILHFPTYLSTIKQ